MADDMKEAAGVFPRPVHAPQASPESKPYWDACASGKLLYKHCTACDEPHFYPRPVCPFCYSSQTEWREASGKGVIYAYTVVRRSPTGPYSLAYVELEEGPRMLTNLVQCDFDALKVGQSVRVVFQPAEQGGAVPMFTVG